jgi:hypothetical protein
MGKVSGMQVYLDFVDDIEGVGVASVCEIDLHKCVRQPIPTACRA